MKDRPKKTHPDSYCGLYCGACPQEDCHGCKSESVQDFCENCEFKSCPEMANLNSCAECPKYPCQMIINLNNDKYPHHCTAIPNLDRIREVGLEFWLGEQDFRWRCSCGTPFTWYDRKCKNCGADVSGFIWDVD